MPEVKFEPFQHILARVTHSKIWFATLFSHYTDDGEIATSTAHLFSPDAVLPYNDETAHLLGTTDDPTPPELEFKFGDKVEVSDNNLDWHKAIYYAACKNKASNLIALKEDLGLLGWKYCRHADW